MPIKPAVRAAKRAIEDKFGSDVVVLNISEISIMADYFIIATAGSPNQLRAIREAVDEALTKHGLPLRHEEGVQTARWILMDFGDIIVHLFCKEDRAYYQLERMWSGAAALSDEDLAD